MTGAITQADATRILWLAGNLSFKLWQQQRIIYTTIRNMPKTTQNVVVLCARQFGKSVLGTILATEDCLRNKDIVVMIIGPTIKQTRAIVNPRMKLITRDAPEGLIRHVKSEDTYYFSNGSELKLGGFDTNSGSERGKTLHKVYIEEIVESNPDSYLDFLRSDLGPALTHSKHAQIVYLTTLPKIPDHPFCLETVPEAQSNGAFFKFTIHDNAKLSKQQFDSCVKLCGGIDSIDFKREYLCEQVRDSSIVLAPEFNEDHHVKQIKLPIHAKFWISGDVGGVRDKSVFHLMCFDFERAKILVIDERAYSPDTGSAVMVAGCRQMEKDVRIEGRYVDCDGQMRVDFMHQHTYPVHLPRKDELEATVNQVRVALTRREVEIDPSCKLLIMTLRSGTFNKNKTDLERTHTLGHMDAFMSLAYGIRHCIRTNPFPLYNGADPHTHYIDTNNPERSQSQEAFLSMFRMK